MDNFYVLPGILIEKILFIGILLIKYKIRHDWPSDTQRSTSWCDRPVDHCSSHASATATCEQRRPKQGEGKDQASDTYKWLPCTWK